MAPLYIHQMNRVNSRNDDSTINIVVVIIIIIIIIELGGITFGLMRKTKSPNERVNEYVNEVALSGARV